MPPDLKIRGTSGKYILKRALEPFVPHDNLYRTKQRDSLMSLAPQFRNGGVEAVRSRLSSQALRDSGLFDGESSVTALIEHPACLRHVRSQSGALVAARDAGRLAAAQVHETPPPAVSRERANRSGRDEWAKGFREALNMSEETTKITGAKITDAAVVSGGVRYSVTIAAPDRHCRLLVPAVPISRRGRAPDRQCLASGAPTCTHRRRSPRVTAAIADSGNAMPAGSFCPNCGTPLFSEAEAAGASSDLCAGRNAGRSGRSPSPQ